MEISFTIYGLPAGKGSTTSRFVPGKGRTFTHSPKSTQDWGHLCKLVAQQHTPTDGLLAGPLALELQFFLPKPKSAPKTKRVWPTKKPDLDKLIRSIGDSLTGLIYVDDAQICHMVVDKDYDVTPRVEVFIRTIEEASA
jgi:crossover junction endodeoxyribonuclease RusA